MRRIWSRRIRFDDDDDTGVIGIEVDAPDRVISARVANAVVDLQRPVADPRETPEEDVSELQVSVA